ncbi:NADH-quinone oxidoreductase subunit J [Edaphobacter sp.]|uniref:NADH-quinone oxidoreductase subunit J family protein n=1 Tax=Edaphobacter sp. TaxID=1934404 RepID=UPI002DBD9BB2|nr:NADH-quinone oxidoreductase subunit J [Edaphobacter sp.]HEU5342347.1 NADH-quinone oxidoreductase subunit J [Edaphobacter sp.]
MLFTIFAIVTVAGATAVICLRNLVHSVLALIVTFAGLAVVYLLLGAQFVGFAQVLVYIGAVAILIVFAILLTRNTGADVRVSIDDSWVWSGVVVAGVFAVLAWAIYHSSVSHSATLAQPATTTQQIGNALMQQYALPLEVIGLLLTAALIGAVTIALREQKEAR